MCGGLVLVNNQTLTQLLTYSSTMLPVGQREKIRKRKTNKKTQKTKNKKTHEWVINTGTLLINYCHRQNRPDLPRINLLPIGVVRIQTTNTETTFPLPSQEDLNSFRPLDSFTLIYPTQRHRGM